MTVACITRSEKGSVIQDAKRRYHIKAHPVDKVVDTTGAGDQYAAGVLAGLSHYGARPETAIHELALRD